MALCVESHDLHADGTGSAGLDFMFMSEEIYSRSSSSIVKVALDENA
jgi:hypothetical protein